MKINTIHDYVNEYNKIIRDAMAEAWDQGYCDGWLSNENRRNVPNPYKEES